MKKSLLAGAVLCALSASAFAATYGQIMIDNVVAGEGGLSNPDNSSVVISKDGGKALTADTLGEVVKIYGRDITLTSTGAETIRVGNDAVVSIGDGTTNTLKVQSAGDAVNVIAASGGAHSPTLNLTAETIEITAEGAGIWAQNNTQSGTAPEKHTVVSIDAKKTTITAGTSGIFAFSNSEVNVTGSLEINAPRAIDARGNSTVNINQSGDGTVVLNGDIVFETPNTPGDSQHSGNIINAYVNVELSEGSSWTGKAYQLYKVNGELSSNVELTQPPYHGNVTGFTLSIKDGAIWTMTGDSFANTLNVENGGIVAIQDGVGTVNVEKFDSNAGIVNLPTSATMTVNAMSGQAELKLATKQDGAVFESGTLNIKASDQASLDVHLMNSTMDKELSSDDINSEQAKTLLSNVGGQGVETKTEVKEGLVNPGFGVNSKGEATTNSANTLMQSSLELASAAPLALNRIMMNDVRKRLGDIRTSNGTHGAWARYDGGKLSGEGGLENDFRTIQVGIDTVPTADAPRMGVAFSYTDSDAEYARGSADMKAYSLAMYSTWMGDNGQFFDLIGRMGTADTDVVVDGQHKGSMDNFALSMSGEFGWRFDVTNSIYVEPQVEATYTYVNGDSLSLSTANYDVDAVHSLLGRIGFAAGMKCPSDYGNVYVRASAVHEFLGDSKITGVNAGNTNAYEIDGKDTWFEYGIGANFNITKSTYMWADVERTTGGALDEDWRATVGVRYAW